MKISKTKSTGILDRMESDLTDLVLSLPGVVGGWVVGGAVNGSDVGGEVGSALHSSILQHSTLHDSSSPVLLRLLHTRSDEQKTGGKHTLIFISVIISISVLRAVTVEQEKPDSQVSSSSSLAQSFSQMKHLRRGGGVVGSEPVKQFELNQYHYEDVNVCILVFF